MPLPVVCLEAGTLPLLLLASVTDASIHPRIELTVKQVLGCLVCTPVINHFPVGTLVLATGKGGSCQEQ